jgi:hypothetical protein
LFNALHLMLGIDSLHLNKVQEMVLISVNLQPQKKMGPIIIAHHTSTVTLWHQTLYGSKMQRGAQNSECHKHVADFTQPLFKFWSSADHYGHLIQRQRVLIM